MEGGVFAPPALKLNQDRVFLVKVFLIGFNKTATTTFHKFFLRNGKKSVHWKVDGRLVAVDVAKNMASFKDPFSGYDEYEVFTDLECVNDKRFPLLEVYKWFSSFYAWHPKAKFILNTRNVDDWISSRLKHGEGRYLEWYLYHYGVKKKEDVVLKWRLDFYQHHYNVLKFFEDKPGSLLVYDIDRDNPEKICSFMKDQCELDSSLFSHDNKTLGA